VKIGNAVAKKLPAPEIEQSNQFRKNNSSESIDVQMITSTILLIQERNIFV